MIRTFILFFVLSSICFVGSTQNKVPLSPSDYDIWNKISGEKISPDGQIITYFLEPGIGDTKLRIVDKAGRDLLTYPRGKDGSFTWNSDFVLFRIKPAYDSIRDLQRKKVPKEDLPGDSLGIFSIREATLEKIPLLKDFKIPEEAGGYFAYRIDLSGLQTEKEDSTSAKKARQFNDKNGYSLVLQASETGRRDTFSYVTDYILARETNAALFVSTGNDSTAEAWVYHYDVDNQLLTPLSKGAQEYSQLAVSNKGDQAAFLLDIDTTDALVRNFKLYHWKEGMKEAVLVKDSSSLESNWIVSKYGDVGFSEDGSKLYFGTSPKPLVQDTALLEDEIVQVEVWNYQDVRLMTQQEKQVEQDKKRSYQMVYHLDKGQFAQIERQEMEEVMYANRYKKNANIALISDSRKYYRNVSWEGFPSRADYYKVDLTDGSRQLIARGDRGYAELSPGGNYMLWYDVEDTAWFAFDLQSLRKVNISKAIPTMMADELDDHPDFPRPYGSAGWSKKDQFVFLYDRYDIWKVDPSGKKELVNLTNGRKNSDRFRVRSLDREKYNLVDERNAISHLFNEVTKDEGYARLNGNSEPETLIRQPFAFGNLEKARQSNQVIFTKSSHERFPDILTAELDFDNIMRISDANPQQVERVWSTVELVSWTSLNGDSLQGLLYKPEDFEPDKKYPMIVYFYERNSDNLHLHRGAFPHRSIINQAYYASRGYLVFIPDIIYRDGYPGQSCYDAVMPGVTMLLEKGYVDKEKIGMQGHSWGGYQTAYLATQTDLFACAESGAPVSNMFSAYGGIRWGSGLSRMFQYEHTQSRIGGTIWEYPLRYLENSPIFFMDRVKTPLLIMHNDEDGAVPWYQGIEMFVALRRLGKPAWMLNYNKEPHWPTKRENIVDFQIRMQQFFDHYLMDERMPVWMSEGIPAVGKGIKKGY